MTESRRPPVLLPAALLIAILATFVRALLVVKLSFVVLFLGAAVWSTMRRGRLPVFPRLIAFYLVIAITGIMWAVIGLLRQGNFDAASIDALRLYGIWSGAFIVLFTLIRSESSPIAIHRGLVLAGILIPLVDLISLADGALGWGLIPEAVREEMFITVTFEQGYLRLDSVNIMLLLVIVPYLIALQLRRDTTALNTRWTKLSLFLSLALAVDASRRAVWIVVAAAPVIVLALSAATSGLGALRRGTRGLLMVYSALVVLAAGAIPLLPESVASLGPLQRLAGAFSSADERTIQKPYLIEGLAQEPILGTGFGAYAGYLRSPETPWMYELTYHQMAFNLGLAGVAIIGLLMGAYFVQVGQLLRRFPADSAVPFALVVAVVSFLVGAYSNPYLGGFDSLFFVGLLPYLATFRRGFAAPSATRSVVAPNVVAG